MPGINLLLVMGRILKVGSENFFEWVEIIDSSGISFNASILNFSGFRYLLRYI